MSNFFRGTSAGQDFRWGNAHKKMLKKLKCDKALKEKVDVSKVNFPLIKKWITERINEILGFEDDVVISLCINMLETEVRGASRTACSAARARARTPASMACTPPASRPPLTPLVPRAPRVDTEHERRGDPARADGVPRQGDGVVRRRAVGAAHKRPSLAIRHPRCLPRSEAA